MQASVPSLLQSSDPELPSILKNSLAPAAVSWPGLEPAGPAMASFTILVPDFQYADDGVVEREAGGDTIAWRLYREHRAERIPVEAWQAADALLCWHVGEERIGFWHSPEDGFAGRKPL